MRISFLIAALAVAVVLILAYEYWPSKASNTDEAAHSATQVPESMHAENTDTDTDTAEVESITRESNPEPAVSQDTSQDLEEVSQDATPVLPELHESDGLVVSMFEPYLASLPQAAGWLQRKDLIARAVGVLVNSADGQVANRQVAFLVPNEPYPVQQAGDVFLLDPRSHARFDLYLDLLERVPPQTLADFLSTVDPLFEQALAQLGEQRSLRQLIQSTRQRLRRLPTLPDQVELLRPSVVYTFADPQLEELPAFDKQMLRLGEHNVSRLEAYLSELAKFY